MSLINWQFKFRPKPDIDGFFAVLLWEDYQQTGNQKALDTLLAYNIQDTINLENLMVTAYNMELRDTPFYESHCIRESTPPPNPFRVDFTTVDRLRQFTVLVVTAMVLKFEMAGRRLNGL